MTPRRASPSGVTLRERCSRSWIRYSAREESTPATPTPSCGPPSTLTTCPHETVASLIMTSLYHQHYGQPIPTLRESPASLRQHVQLQAPWRMFLGMKPPVQRPYFPAMRPILSTEQWAQMQSWHADSCDGSLMRYPENTLLVRLMSATVRDTGWRSQQAESTPLALCDPHSRPDDLF